MALPLVWSVFMTPAYLCVGEALRWNNAVSLVRRLASVAFAFRQV